MLRLRLTTLLVFATLLCAAPAVSVSPHGFDRDNPIDDPLRDGRSGDIGLTYNWVDNREPTGPEYNWIDITEIGQRLHLQGASWNTGPLELGWTFRFYGREWGSLRVCTHGWASFTSSSTRYRPYELPFRGEPFNLLAVQWSFLVYDQNARIYFWTDEQEEIAVVSWNNIPTYGNEGNERQTFQMILSGDDQIIYQYQDSSPPRWTNCIGIQNEDGTEGLTIAFSSGDSAWSERAIGIGFPWIEYPDNPGIYVDTDTLDFGEAICEQEEVGWVTVTNVGGEDLQIEDITVDNDVFQAPDLEYPLTIPSRQSRTFSFLFSPEEREMFEGTIIIRSDAENAEDGETHIPVRGQGVSLPEFPNPDPLEVYDELISGELSQHILTFRNIGEGTLRFNTDIEIISMPDQGVPRPERVESRFALFSERPPFQYDIEQIFQSLEGLDYDHYDDASAFGDVDLSNYEVIWVANGQSSDFKRAYNRNLEKIEEFVDHGGVYYMCTGDENQVVVPEHPGGLHPTYQIVPELVTNISGEDNYLFALMDWEAETELGGFGLASYSLNNLDNIENCEYIEVLVRKGGEDELTPVVVTYNYGCGFCVVSGTLDGYLHRDMENFMWGRTGPNMLKLLDYLYYLNRWVTVTPIEGQIEEGQQMEIMVDLSAERHIEGEYSAYMLVDTNDPQNPSDTVSIDLVIFGIPEIDVTWADSLGYPVELNWNEFYPDLFNNVAYGLPLLIRNRGSSLLRVSEYWIDSDYFDIDSESFEIEPGYELEITVTFTPPSTDVYTAVLTLVSNDPDEEESLIQLNARSAEPPEIYVAQEDIESELFQGAESVHWLNIANEGEALLRFRITHEFLQEPDRDYSAGATPRSLAPSPPRSLASSPPRSLAPMRDEAFGTYAVFQDRGPWGWYSQSLMDRIDVDYDLYDNPADIGEVDLSGYQAIIVAGNKQSRDFTRNCRNSADWFEEYVDDGGAMYIETGGHRDSTIYAPGNITCQHIYDMNGVIAIGGDENFLVSLVGWHQGDVLPGSPFMSASFSWVQFEELILRGDSEWYQIIARGQSNHNPGVVAYNYGEGGVVVAGCPVGHQWRHFSGSGQWGSCGEELLYYLISLGNTSWLSYYPWTGQIEGGEEDSVQITLNGYRKDAGDEYEAELHIISNDPDRPEVDIPVRLAVISAPDIVIEWHKAAGYPDEIDLVEFFGGLYVGYEYEIELVLFNSGSQVLEIDSMRIFSEYFDFELDDNTELDVGEKREITVTFVPGDDDGDYSTEMLIVSNDPDEGEVMIPINAVVQHRPIISLSPLEIEDDLKTGQVAEHIITVGNEGLGTLEFVIDTTERVRQDRRVRTLRSIRSFTGPCRDDEVEVKERFSWGRAVVNTYKAGIAWDSDNEWMWLSTYPSNWIGAINPANDFSEMIFWRTHGQSPMGMTWIDGVIYNVSRRENWLGRWDAEGNNLGNLNLGMEPTALTGLQRDNLLLVIDDDHRENIEVFTTEGEHVGTINNYLEYIQNEPCRSICWVARHAEGQLWLNTPQHIWELAVNTQDWEITDLVQDMEWDGSQEWDGIGHDGNDLWLGAYNLHEYLIVDDRIDEHNWLTFEPSWGTLEFRESMEVLITLDAHYLSTGVNRDTLHFRTNDPEAPDLEVTVTMNVEGRSLIHTVPIAKPLPNAPDELVFPDTYIGEGLESRIPVVIRNSGSENLLIEPPEYENEEDFTIDFEEGEFTIVPNEFVCVDLVFHPVDRGERTGAVHLYTSAGNDELDEDGHIWWDLTGFGQDPPDGSIDPPDGSWMEARMDMIDDPVEHEIIISNSEGLQRADLTFEISVVYFDADRDPSQRTLRRIGMGIVPDRDQPQSRYALFAQTSPWGFDLEDIFDEIEGIDCDRYRSGNDFADIDFSGYEVIWVGNFQSDQWNARYNNNLERVEEFVDGGGVYYMCTGTEYWNVAPVHPGGLVRQQEYIEEWGVTNVPMELNYLVRHMRWIEGTRLGGDPFCNAGYDEDDLENIENSSSCQVIISGAQGNIPIVVVYNYGRGWCVVSGTRDGALHSDPDNPWGQAGTVMLEYLDFLARNTSWLEYEPSAGVVEAGDEETVSVLFISEGLEDDTHYYAQLLISTNDPQIPLSWVHCYLRIGLPDHFPPSQTELRHMIFVDDILAGGESVQSGWEVGVFTPDDVLAGGEVWMEGNDQFYINAYGDDPETEQVEGFVDGEPFRFRIWDSENDQEYDALHDVIDGPSVWEADGMSTVSISLSRQMELQLHRGWNFISINILPQRDMYLEGEERGPDIILMTDQLRIDENRHRIFILKDEAGRFYFPQEDYCNIPYWAWYEGYVVKMNEDATASWIGFPIPPDRDLPIEEGWNHIPYFPTYDLDASAPDYYAVSSIIDNVVIAKDDSGRFMAPRWGYSDMPPWREGEGYQINVDDNVVLNYPPERQEGAGFELPTDEWKDVHWAFSVLSGENMSLLLSSIEGLPGIDDHDQIGAFDVAGKLVGVGLVKGGRCGLAVWGDDRTTGEVEGLSEGEPFELRYWDRNLQAEMKLHTLKIQHGQGLAYLKDGFVVLDVRAEPNIPTDYYLAQNYPNPFNGYTRIPYGLPEPGMVNIRIFDLNGRLVRELIDEEQPAGHHAMMWDARTVPSGFYISAMSSRDFRAVRRMILIK